jgi:hypothetical protein
VMKRNDITVMRALAAIGNLGAIPFVDYKSSAR